MTPQLQEIAALLVAMYAMSSGKPVAPAVAARITKPGLAPLNLLLGDDPQAMISGVLAALRRDGVVLVPPGQDETPEQVRMVEMLTAAAASFRRNQQYYLDLPDVKVEGKVMWQSPRPDDAETIAARHGAIAGRIEQVLAA
jgi:hypothetical protein